MKRTKYVEILFVNIIIVIILFGCNFSGMSARELYDACSASHIPQDKRSAEDIIKLKRCEELANRVFYENGFIYVGEEQNPKIQELKKYCPSTWTSPIGGPYIWLLQHWDRYGMGFFQRHFQSADDAALDIFKSMFPECSKRREAEGVPKVTDY
jgi:hypothetical protein